MSKKLVPKKPCPFCGGRAIVDVLSFMYPKKERVFKVKCSWCRSSTGGYFTNAKAVHAWENRV